jgi:hypothetical protein
MSEKGICMTIRPQWEGTSVIDITWEIDTYEENVKGKKIAYMSYEIEASVVPSAANDLQQQHAETVHILHEW